MQNRLKCNGQASIQERVILDGSEEERNQGCDHAEASSITAGVCGDAWL